MPAAKPTPPPTKKPARAQQTTKSGNVRYRELHTNPSMRLSTEKPISLADYTPKALNHARAKLDAVGIDAIEAAILDGKSINSIAKAVNVGQGAIYSWMEATAEKSARCERARDIAARHWDELAERFIAGATTALELAKAQNLAHHYRWRAARMSRRTYGDREEIDVTVAPAAPQIEDQNRARDRMIALLERLERQPLTIEGALANGHDKA